MCSSDLSWQEDVIKRLVDLEGMFRVRADQCQYGAEVARGMHKGRPVKKPSGFMTNSTRVAAQLMRRCQGRGGVCSRPQGGVHKTCEGSIARDAQIYPRGLRKAILRGITEQLRDDGHVQAGCFGIQAKIDDDAVEQVTKSVEQGYSGRYRDDLTGQVLKDSLVQEARRKELAYFGSKKVWIKVPKGEARARTGRPPISVRWVDVNKGDDMNPN